MSINLGAGLYNLIEVNGKPLSDNLTKDLHESSITEEILNNMRNQITKWYENSN